MKRIRKVNSYRRSFNDTVNVLYPHYVDRYINSLENMTKKQMLSKNITFVVTEKCNLACTYCYQCNKDMQAIMTKDVAKKAVDLILDNERMNGYVDSNINQFAILEFIGGEPLLAIDIIDYIVDYFKYKTTMMDHHWKTQYMISMTSNGVLYKDPKVQKFLSKNKGRVSITITIDGDKDLHDACRVFHNGEGSYNTVVESIKLAQKQVGMKSTKVTLAPENLKYISTSIPHLFQLGLTDINANVVFEDVWVPERDAPLFYKELIKLADYIIDNDIYEHSYCSLFDESIGRQIPSEDNQNWCGGDGQMLAIGTDGRLFPCIRYMKYSLQNKDLPEFEIGSIDRGIDKQEDNEYLQCLSCITRKSQSTDECFDCKVGSGCAWCSGYNYDIFGTPNKRATFICWLHKARVLANKYYWDKLSKRTGKQMNFNLNLTEKEIDFIINNGGKENE